MKKIYVLFILSILFTINAFAQTPEKLSYQAIIRNSSGIILSNQGIGIQISILKGSNGGIAVYAETQNPITNANGLISIEIGSGTLVSGDFTSIDWAADIYFIKTEIDTAGGTNYTITGSSQLISVPYALHAKTAETITGSISETDPIYLGSDAFNITATDITKLSNLSGTNTGDQDISGIATNASAITAIETEQGTQNTAIALNTAKVTNAIHTGDVTGSTVLMISDDAVTTTKLLDANVTNAKLANGAVTALKINGITSNGTANQMISSNADGSFSWVDAPIVFAWGKMNNGVRISGSPAWTSSRVGTGQYRIVFPSNINTTDFLPFVEINIDFGTADSDNVFTYGWIDATTLEIWSWDVSSNSTLLPQDRPVNFFIKLIRIN